MQPLTLDQELTMIHWVSTIGELPGMNAKLFLQVEKDLLPEQIDAWWGRYVLPVSHGENCEYLSIFQVLLSH
jgi:hypothetical protein